MSNNTNGQQQRQPTSQQDVDRATRSQGANNRSRLNPFSWPDRLRQYATDDPQQPPAAEVDDPHTWSDPDGSRWARFTPSTPAQWLVVIASGLILSGLLLYLRPIIGPTFHNPLTIAFTVLIGSYILVYLKGRQDGFDAWIDIPKSVVYGGDWGQARPVEDAGVEDGKFGRERLVQPYTDVSYGAFRWKHLPKRVLPYDPQKLRAKSSTQDDAGEEPVTDALNPTTVEVDTETLGKLYITHASGWDYDEHGQQADRRTTNPETIDENVVEDMNNVINSMQKYINALEQGDEVRKQANEHVRDIRNQELVPEMRKTMRLLTNLTEQFDSRRTASSDQPVANHASNGKGESVNDIVQGVEEDVQ